METSKMKNSTSILFICIILLVSVIIEVSFATFTEESGNYDNDNGELKSLLQKLKRLESKRATPEDRAYLIRWGYLKSAENFRYPISSKPENADVAFDCKIRALAYMYGKKLSPGSGQGNELKSIFDGLELDTLCNRTFEDSSFEKKSTPYVKVNTHQVNIYVDNNNGLSSNDGSFATPIEDIQSGVDLCKHKRRNTMIQCNVFIRSGVYHINAPLAIREDNIRVVAYNGETVQVSSDVNIVPNWKVHKLSMELFKGFNPLFEGIKPNQSTIAVKFLGIVKNSQICEQKCNKISRCTSFVFFDKSTKEYMNHCYIRMDGKWNTLITQGAISGKKVSIYSSDLSGYKLKKVDSVFINGRRAIRARFPNADPETMGLHTIPTGYVQSADKWLPPIKLQKATDVVVKSPVRANTLFPSFGIGIGGTVHQFKPPQSYWGTEKPVGGGGSTYRVPAGLQYSKNLEINLRSWKNASSGIVHAYQSYHWGNWMFKLDGRDEKSKTLHWSYGGFQESRGSNFGKEWFVENIFEELDVANEWFYDESSKVLYYSPNLTAAELPKKLSIPQMACLCQVIGSKTRPIKNTVIQGITFEHSTKTFLEPYMVPSGGDWSVHRNGVVYLEGTEGTLIDKCTFDSSEGNSIFVSNYNRGTVISHNSFYRLGDNAIVLVGDSHLIDGTQGNQPRGVKVLYNIVHDNGIWVKQSCPFVQSLSCESYLEGNVFFNGPRAGMNFNDGFGGGNVVNSNLLFNFVRETDDHGPINSWDRVPYLTRVYDGENLSLDVKENQIHNNLIINNYRSVWPIDHDDGSSMWNDTHNYLVYGGFKNYLGHDKHSMHNIYVYPDKHGGKGASFSYRFCLQTAGQTLGTSGYGDVYRKNKCIIGKPDLYSLGNCKKQYIRELIPYLTENHYYTPNATFLAHCGSEKWTLKEFQMLGMEIDTIVQNLVDDDTVIEWGKSLLKIQDGGKPKNLRKLENMTPVITTINYD